MQVCRTAQQRLSGDTQYSVALSIVFCIVCLLLSIIFYPMPQISVIIPTFNRKHLLERAVDSVIRQTYKDFELIIVDDASEDGTETLDIFSGESENIVPIRFPLHCGVSAARNAGVQQAQASWICFLDSDDEWHKDKLKRQMQWHTKHPEFRIFQTKEIWIRNGKRVNSPKTHEKISGWQFAENLERCMITPSSVMMEKSLFLEAGQFNESIPACEDYDLWLRITAAYPVGLVDEFLLTRYGGHSDQLSAEFIGLDRFRIRSIAQLLATTPLSEAMRKAATNMLITKTTIVANGYTKRGMTKEYEHYLSIARFYAEN
jgi:glycosyltransferase involved in cell wall biosynthesis